jgi:hypothetical protein
VVSGPVRKLPLPVCSSVVDPHHLDADPDSTYHPDADPDADPESDFLFAVNPDADTDPDPSFKKTAQTLETVQK